jgi:hypothetical protein
LGFKNIPNQKMSNLLEKYYKKYKSWPRDLLDKYQKKLIGKPVWNKNDFVTPSRFGYSFAEHL